MDTNKANSQLIDLGLVEDLEKIDRDFESRHLAGGGGHRRVIARTKMRSQFQKNLLKSNEVSVTSTAPDIYSKLVSAIPKKDDRLKAARRMARLLAKGEVVSPFSLARCINHKIQRKTFRFSSYKDKVENIIYRTIRKYWHPHGFAVIPVNLPKTGYQLKAI